MITDEIDFPTFQKDSSTLEAFLQRHDGPHGLKFLTYSKLASLQTTWNRYYQTLQDNFGFHIEAGDVVVDIGAHHGIVSLNCARMGARVIACEPNPINVAILQRNLELNPSYTVKLEAKAVTAEDGPVVFNFGKTSTTGALELAERDWKRTDTNLTVEGVSLNSLLIAHGVEQIKLLKIDCEGGEYAVLSQTPSHVLRRAEYLCAEAHPTRRYQPDRIQKLLENAGFQVISLPGDHGCLELFSKRLI